MKQKLTLTYLPTDLNTYINTERGNRYAAAKIKKEETYLVAWLCKEQKLKPITKKVGINFWWHVKGRKDPDNVCFAKKFLIDGLVSAGILKNDSLQEIDWFSDTFVIDKTEGVIVELVPIKVSAA